MGGERHFISIIKANVVSGKSQVLTVFLYVTPDDSI
jgi:hypothetical protein